MSAIVNGLGTQRPIVAGLLRSAVVALTLATAWIHATLGGPLFTLNAIGYSVLAVAMVAPGAIARSRWLVRLALLGFVSMTIGGWVAFGARFDLAYIDKGIEAILVAVLFIELWLEDGGPVAVARRIAGLFQRALAMVGLAGRAH